MNVPAVLAGLPTENKQVLIVVPREGGPVWEARAVVTEKNGGSWQTVLGPFPAVAGRNGFALPGEKREGDGKTPSGIFPIEHAFGDGPSIPSALPYRQIEDDDVWVDDPLSDNYNAWTKRADARALSYEEMKRPDGLYRYGILLGYNRNPAAKALGSAIFVHLWRGCDVPTSGCVALAENSLFAILGRLNPALGPLSLVGRFYR